MSELSRASQGEEKKTETYTTRIPCSMGRFIEVRYKQKNMESVGEYIRSLIEKDIREASSDFNLLADALGAQVNIENIATTVSSK